MVQARTTHGRRVCLDRLGVDLIFRVDGMGVHVSGKELRLYGGNPLPDSENPKQIEAAFGDQVCTVLPRYPRTAYDSASVALATAVTDARWARPALDGNKQFASVRPTSPETTSTPS
jgi:hypothetical protein